MSKLNFLSEETFSGHNNLPQGGQYKKGSALPFQCFTLQQNTSIPSFRMVYRNSFISENINRVLNSLKSQNLRFANIFTVLNSDNLDLIVL